jgi:hypothetical protein
MSLNISMLLYGVNCLKRRNKVTLLNKLLYGKAKTAAISIKLILKLCRDIFPFFLGNSKNNS